MLKKGKIFILGALMISSLAVAQTKPPIVDARLEPDSVAIGDQFHLEVTVTKDQVQIVDFPMFENGIIGEKIEILKEGAVDTILHEGRTLTLRKRYLLTTFDEGYYSLGRFPTLYMDKNIVDTLWSRDSLLLKVGTYEIDTVKQTIYDIREPLHTPVKFGEISGYLIWGLIIGAAIALLVFYIIRRRKRIPLFGKPSPADPPHVKAIKALEELHHQKVWQNNKHKQYYTRLTDIIREYLEERYGVHAPEMTSDEVLEAIVQFSLPERSVNELRHLLRSADMVKFAKQIPDSEDNETAFTAAYYFVEQTKPTEIEPVDSDPKEVTV